MKTRLPALSALVALFTIPATLFAASGTWINTAGGSWTNTANWSGGVVAGGADSTGFFDTLNIPANAIVTLDGAQTIGNLQFSDTTAPVTNWVINPGTGGSLTLAVSSGSPKITLTNAQAVINSVISGMSGLTKAGAGILQLTATNTFTGTVIVDSTSAGNNSILAFTTPAAFAGQPIQLGLNPDGNTSRLVASGGELTLTNNIEIRCVRTVIGSDVVNGIAASNQTWTGNVLLNHAAAGVRDFIMQRNLTISGVISGGPAGLNLNSGNLFLNGQNTYTNGTTITGGILYLGCPSSNALPAGGVSLSGGRVVLNAHEQINDASPPTFTLTPATNNSRFQLNGFNETVAGIQDNATNGNRIVEAANDFVTNAPGTLTLNVPTGQSYTHNNYIRNGTAPGSTLTLIKKGLGTQTFSAGSSLVSYTGTTTVESGTLEISGAASVLANSPVVLSGGTLLLDSATAGTRNQRITGSGTLRKSNAGNLLIPPGVTNNFTGTTILDAATFQVQAGAEHNGNDVVVNGGNMEVLGAMHAASATVNGGVLISGNGSTFTSLITGPVTNKGGTIRGWATFDNVTLQSGIINPATTTTVGTLTVSNLTCQGGTLAFNLDAANTTTGSGVNDLLAVQTLTMTAPTMLDIPGAASLTGARYVVMTYYSLVGGLSALTNNLFLNPTVAGTRALASIDYGTIGEVAVAFGSPAAPAKSLTWVGDQGGGVWDINTTTNWLDVSTPEKFFNSDAVTFDDTASNTTVNVSTAVYPGGVVFNNPASNYTVAGTGPIVSAAGLSKTGSGNLTLNVPYQGGGVTNSGGVLVLTNASFGTRLEINANSTVVMTGSNSFNGAFALDPSNLGGGTLIITNGGTLYAPVTGGSFNLQNDNDLLVVAGAGSTLNVPGVGGIQIGNAASSTGNRVILRDGGAWTNIPNNFVLPNGANANNNHLILTNGGRLAWSPTGVGNVLLGHGAGSFDNSLQVMGASSVLDLNGRTFYCGRQGNNNVATINAGVATNLGAIVINDLAAGSGNGLQVLNGGRVYNSGGINMGQNAGSVNAFLTVDNGSVWAASANVGISTTATGTRLTITNGGSVTISNTLTVTNVSSAVNFSSGTLTLGGASVKNGQAFTAGDGVSAATLALTGGSYTFTNGLTISANATLKGSGTVNDITVVNGTLAPGLSVGALTFTNNLTLAGSTLMEIDKANNTNDSATVLGTLTYGGTLTVTNLGGTLAPGDSFKLFNFTGTPGSFASAPTLPTLGGGLAWTNTLAVDGRIAVISTSSIPSTPTNITFAAGSGNITIGWPSNYVGWILQSQTNSRSVGLTPASNTWFDVPGSAGLTLTNLPVNPAQPTVFFRLRYP